jgi:hypothetical protein
MRRALVALAALLAAGCGGGGAPPASTPSPAPSPRATVAGMASPRATATPIPLTAADGQLCPALYARLQRVTLALTSSSELIAQSENKADLTRRIATEQQQLARSARLMAAATVPAPLSAVNDRLVGALRTFSRDFGRARAPAAKGDFPAAVSAMTDKRAVNRILAAATAIQRACQPSPG